MALGVLGLLASAEPGEALWLGKAGKDLEGLQFGQAGKATGGGQQAGAKIHTCWQLKVLILLFVPSSPQAS